MGHGDRTGFLSWERFMVLDRFNPLKWIGMAADQMGSGVIFYKYEKREKFEDHDMRADAELGTFKIRRYHFDNESFVHPLHSVRFDPDRPYEIPIEALMANKIASVSKSEESSAER
ncbi:hypothetical protein PIB30_060116 [Stylosanthes scabra]|uniref:Uncharacterized protein n=1 Tax=Stylosanthes scabra TaxID=79078 RepID=A0ABU6VIV5_9FABA|nr:hypothetical protein [Stylosanthes scabra]